MSAAPIPDPALVVLVGASGAGKSSWAQARYRAQEIVSSDDLRGIVGSGRHDLDATDDAFRLLDQIVAARTGRGLTTVVDTLGLDTEKRRSYVAVARRGGMAAVAVVFDTHAEVCRERNRTRERPVPSPVLTQQIRRARAAESELADEGWDVVATVAWGGPAGSAGPTEAAEAAALRADDAAATPADAPQPGVILQVSRFPWGDDPAAWLRDVALAADAAGFAGIALMDHLIQIPQVGRAWDPIPEPFTTLGMLAGLDTRLRLGTLCTPVTFRPGGIIAKTVATLDVLTGGRAFVGVGAGWWDREHAAFGVPFPGARQRLDDLETSVETLRALWAAGTKAYPGAHVDLPETTSYPRPVGEPMIIVGGGGDRILRIAAELGDACNVLTNAALEHRLEVFEKHRARAERDVRVTVLDLPVVGRDRDDVWRRVEGLRGRTPAAAYARSHHAATAKETAERYRRLFERGVETVFVSPAGLAGADDVLALEPLTTANG